MKVNLNLNDELVRQMDEVAEANFLTRTAFITSAISDKLYALEVKNTLKRMNFLLEKIDRTGVLDEQSMAEFDTVCKMLGVK